MQAFPLRLSLAAGADSEPAHRLSQRGVIASVMPCPARLEQGGIQVQRSVHLPGPLLLCPSKRQAEAAASFLEGLGGEGPSVQ